MGPPPQVGAYRLTAELGRGAMGVVYRGLAPDGREVAVKVLNPANLSPTGAARFEREARLSQELVHPNLIRVYESGVHGGQRYLVMELVSGVSLEERLRQGPLPNEEVRDLARALCAGLGAAHARGVLHRDLKPANVLMGRTRVVLTDFGLALDASEDRERLTKTGALLGSPAYMAPEQIEGKSPLVGPRTDVYGLGATLYEAMTGQPPFSAPSLLEIAVKVTAGRPSSPLKLNPRADPGLAEVCLRCLASDPAERYGSAEEVALDLEPQSPSRGKSRGLIGVGAVLILSLALGLGLAGSSWEPTATSDTTPSPSPSASQSPSPSPSPPASPTPDPGHALAAKGDILGALAALGESPQDLALRAELLFWRSSKLFFERGNGSRKAILSALLATPGDPFLAALYHQAWRGKPRPEGSPPRPRRGLPAALLNAWDLAAKRSQDLEHRERVFEAFQRAHELDPGNRWAHHGRVRYSGEFAKATKLSRDFARARSLAQEAHEAWPRDPIMTWRVAWTFKVEGEALINDASTRPRALELLRQAVGIMDEVHQEEPRWAFIPLERGYTKFLIAKISSAPEVAGESLRDLALAIRLRPGYAHAHYTLGIVSQDLKLFEQAEKSYREAIRLDLNVASYYHRLSNLYLERGEVDKARSLLSSAVEVPALSARDRATLRRVLSKLPPR